MTDMRVLTTPVYPYMDDPNEWCMTANPLLLEEYQYCDVFIHTRLPSLMATFNYITKKTEYQDNLRWTCVDLKNNVMYSRFVDNILNEMYPIKFPYYGERNIVYCEEFLSTSDWPEEWPQYDTFAIHYILKEYKAEKINKYYKAVVDENMPSWMSYREKITWVEISEREFNLRKKEKVHA